MYCSHCIEHLQELGQAVKKLERKALLRDRVFIVACVIIILGLAVVGGRLFAFTVQFSQQPAQIHGFGRPTCIQRLQANLPRLGFPEFIWAGSNLFGLDDRIVCIDGSDHVSASALNSKAMEPFRRIVDGGDFEVIVAVGDDDRDET